MGFNFRMESALKPSSVAEEGGSDTRELIGLYCRSY